MLDALFATVKANPDDDHARLVLADALQEAGDPRGALITLQLQLAALRVDPDSPDWNARKAAERELLAAHRDAWKPAAFAQLQVEFRRGFVEKITGRLSELRALVPELLAAFPLLRAVESHDHRPPAEEVALFIETPLAGQLIELTVGADDEVAELLGRLTGLRSLSIRAHGLSARGVAAIARLSSLRSLALENATVEDALTLPAGLEELTILGDELGAKGAEVIARCQALRKLQLIDADIGDAGASVLARAGLPALQSLSLENCELGASSGKTLGASTSQLVALDLRGNRLGKAGVSALLNGKGLTALRELGLRECALKDAGVKAVADSPRVLERLDFRDNGLTDAAVSTLASSASLKALRVLNVNRNHLTREGQEALRAAFPSTAIYSAHQTRK